MRDYKNDTGLVLAILCIVIPSVVSAYKIEDAMFSPIGGSFSSAGADILSCNMQPYGSPSQADFSAIYAGAVTLAGQGSEFLHSLSLFDCADNPDNPVCALLNDKSTDYEQLGFIDAFDQQGTETALLSAISTFAYLISHGYQVDEATQSLKGSLRDLVSIYMVFADEFLIDALDFRFSSSIPNMDSYLDEQIAQLEKAIYYYQIGAQLFMSVWCKPIVSSNQIIGEFFTQDEWDLFNLLYERLSMSMREKGVRERVRMAKSSEVIREELSSFAAELYVQVTALSATLGENFSSYGGDNIITAFNLIRKQLSDINNGRNPLGYDERYVPLNDYDSLYGLALNAYESAQELEATVAQEVRDYDYILDKVEEQQLALETNYKGSLAELTGCSVSLSNDDFMLCAESAGEALYNCPMTLEAEAFDACVDATIENLGILGAKYRQIKDADLSLERAKLQYENIGKRIENENARTNYLIEIWKDYTGAQKEAWSNYQKNMKNACTITETYDYDKKIKSKEKSFELRDDALGLSITKEKELLDATLTFHIKEAQDPTTVRNLLLEQAEALVAIDVAVNNENTMIAAYDASIRQKENLLALWKRNEEFLTKYWSQKLPTHRVIQSQAILSLADKLNEIAHYSYLATKALEYKYMQVLEGVSVGASGSLNYTDIFKCQTRTDFKSYLDKLVAYNKLECPAGCFQTNTYQLSLAIEVLGLTNKKLGDLDGDGYVDSTGELVDDIRYERVQEFVNGHLDNDGNLTFTFTTSVYDDFLVTYKKANLKIWQGAVPFSESLQTKGLTASLHFTGNSGAIKPVIYIAQKGIQPFLRKNGEMAECYPVKTFALMNSTDTTPEPFTYDVFNAFNGVDPRSESDPWGKWSNAFTNRGVASTEWTVTVYRDSAENASPIQFNKIKDIRLYLDTIGNALDQQ